MLINKTLIRLITMTMALLFPVQQALAIEDDLCVPFKDAKIDQTYIETMLSAADDGYLYRVKTNSSKMGFCVESSIGVVKGDFQKFKGGISLAGDNSQTLMTIDVASLETNALFIEEILKGDGFFDAETYPELLFVSSSFEWIDSKNAILKGLLSMRGVTKPVAFYVEINEVDGDLGDSDSIMVKATTTVHRTEFGMSSLSSMVDDKVNLCMSLEAEKYRS